MHSRFLFAALGAFVSTVTAAAASDGLVNFQSQGAPGMCLSMEVGAVAIRPCDDGVTQAFNVYPTFQGDGMQLVIGNNGLMIGPENKMLTSKTLGGSEQSTAFTLGSDGSISAGGLCIDVKGGNRQAGTPVIAFRCNSQINQRWTRVDSARTRTPVRAAKVQGMLSPTHAPGMCIGNNGTGQLVLVSCGETPDFALATGGVTTTVQDLDSRLCLTAPGVSGRPIVLGQSCNREVPTVQWGLSDKGLLRSADGLCADVKGGGRTAGTPVIAFNCSGNPNQRFTFIPNN
jgi:hypothetical protein